MPTEHRVLLPPVIDPGQLGDVPPNVALARYAGAVPTPAEWDGTTFLVASLPVDPSLGDVLADIPTLRTVQVLTAGVEWIVDRVPDGVQLCSGKPVHAAAVADWVLAATLASIRQFPAMLADAREQRWRRRLTGTLTGRRVTILGAGSIGASVKARLRGFDVTITDVARTARDGVRGVVELPSILPRTDVLIVLVPQTAETTGLVDADALALLPDGALVVNAARGPIVDTDALVAELLAGRLTAALDVTDPEPLPAGHPLWMAPGTLITAHVGGATDLLGPLAHRLLAGQLARLGRNEPLDHLVTGAY